MGKQPEFSWHQLHHKIDTEQIQDTSQPFGQSWERQSAHGQPHPPGERHCSLICISSITISEALCSMKWSLPAATEEILNYKWRSELTQPKKGEVEGGSGRHEPNVVYKDLDSLLSFFFFSPWTFFCDLGLPVTILCRNLSMFPMHWKGQCSAPEKTSYLHTWSLLDMLGMAPRYRASGATLATGRHSFCLYHFIEQEAPQSPKTRYLFWKGLRALFQKWNYSAPSS